MGRWFNPYGEGQFGPSPSHQHKGNTMEIDNESTNKELAVRILGLLHVINLLEEFGEYPF